MNWVHFTIGALLLWGSYSIFGAKATNVHGQNVTIAFEAVVFVVLAVLVSVGNLQQYKMVTTTSAVNATIMAMMSVGGFYCLLTAIRLSPANVGMITLIPAMYPIITLLLIGVTVKHLPHFLPDAKPVAFQQVVGAIIAVSGIIIANWEKNWGDKIIHLFK